MSALDTITTLLVMVCLSVYVFVRLGETGAAVVKAAAAQFWR